MLRLIKLIVINALVFATSIFVLFAILAGVALLSLSSAGYMFPTPNSHRAFLKIYYACLGFVSILLSVKIYKNVKQFPDRIERRTLMITALTSIVVFFAFIIFLELYIGNMCLDITCPSLIHITR